MGGNRESGYRCFQDATWGVGINDCHWPFIPSSIQKGGKFTGDNRRTKGRHRPFIENVNPAGNTGGEKERRGVIMKPLKILKSLFSRKSNDISIELQQLNEKREEQNRRLIEITRATIDGETDWFFDLVKKDPSCALRVINECKKGET